MKEPQVSKPRHIILTAITYLLFPVAVFVIAGDFKWIEGWIFAVIWLIWLYALLIYLVKKDPGLLRERFASTFQKEEKEEQDIQQKRWDKPILMIFNILAIVWIIGTPLDAKRFALSPEFPILAKVIGAVFLNIGLAILVKAFMDNPFASPVVRIQKDRKQRVVSTGIYSIVRHPAYLAGIFLFMGMPVLLGSFVGVGCSIVVSILLAIRAVKEEDTLADELEGYDEYRKKVRYRMIPFIF
ncbi:MAG: isoprenylcysteine carboxylmethyltransferase family protein [Theionarchaea archaeon]|nr:isoprenylcysteine carboxylmethyltransferase family protein [Theionarchaea archaeon]